MHECSRSNQDPTRTIRLAEIDRGGASIFFLFLLFHRPVVRTHDVVPISLPVPMHYKQKQVSVKTQGLTCAFQKVARIAVVFQW